MFPVSNLKAYEQCYGRSRIAHYHPLPISAQKCFELLAGALLSVFGATARAPTLRAGAAVGVSIVGTRSGSISSRSSVSSTTTSVRIDRRFRFSVGGGGGASCSTRRTRSVRPCRQLGVRSVDSSSSRVQRIFDVLVVHRELSDTYHSSRGSGNRCRRNNSRGLRA